MIGKIPGLILDGNKHLMRIFMKLMIFFAGLLLCFSVTKVVAYACFSAYVRHKKIDIFFSITHENKARFAKSLSGLDAGLDKFRVINELSRLKKPDIIITDRLLSLKNYDKTFNALRMDALKIHKNVFVDDFVDFVNTEDFGLIKSYAMFQVNNVEMFAVVNERMLLVHDFDKRLFELIFFLRK